MRSRCASERRGERGRERGGGALLASAHAGVSSFARCLAFAALSLSHSLSFFLSLSLSLSAQQTQALREAEQHHREQLAQLDRRHKRERLGEASSGGGGAAAAVPPLARAHASSFTAAAEQCRQPSPPPPSRGAATLTPPPTAGSGSDRSSSGHGHGARVHISRHGSVEIFRDGASPRVKLGTIAGPNANAAPRPPRWTRRAAGGVKATVPPHRVPLPVAAPLTLREREAQFKRCGRSAGEHLAAACAVSQSLP